jgi:ABC-type lipoprotein release transport system permease subunit
MKDANENSAYEVSDARVPQVLAGVAILFAGIVFSLIVSAFVYRGSSVRLIQSTANMSFKHGPENESTIVRDWREQDKLVREHLESYAWVDREKGWVRIPIERAMELLAHPAENPALKKP